jgi:hypothetical protein
MSIKSSLVTFKVEPSLAELIDRLPNKSEFIRRAVLAAIANVCPLCQGSGVLTPQQQEHWGSFTKGHKVERCDDCDAVVLQCDRTRGHH